MLRCGRQGKNRNFRGAHLPLALLSTLRISTCRGNRPQEPIPRTDKQRAASRATTQRFTAKNPQKERDRVCMAMRRLRQRRKDHAKYVTSLSKQVKLSHETYICAVYFPPPLPMKSLPLLPPRPTPQNQTVRVRKRGQISLKRTVHFIGPSHLQSSQLCSSRRPVRSWAAKPHMSISLMCAPSSRPTYANSGPLRPASGSRRQCKDMSSSWKE